MGNPIGSQPINPVTPGSINTDDTTNPEKLGRNQPKTVKQMPDNPKQTPGNNPKTQKETLKDRAAKNITKDQTLGTIKSGAITEKSTEKLHPTSPPTQKETSSTKPKNKDAVTRENIALQDFELNESTTRSSYPNNKIDRTITANNHQDEKIAQTRSTPEQDEENMKKIDDLLANQEPTPDKNDDFLTEIDDILNDMKSQNEIKGLDKKTYQKELYQEIKNFDKIVNDRKHANKEKRKSIDKVLTKFTETARPSSEESTKIQTYDQFITHTQNSLNKLKTTIQQLQNLIITAE